VRNPILGEGRARPFVDATTPGVGLHSGKGSGVGALCMGRGFCSWIALSTLSSKLAIRRQQIDLAFLSAKRTPAFSSQRQSGLPAYRRHVATESRLPGAPFSDCRTNPMGVIALSTCVTTVAVLTQGELS
jgi:hypothetical protein